MHYFFIFLFFFSSVFALADNANSIIAVAGDEIVTSAELKDSIKHYQANNPDQKLNKTILLNLLNRHIDLLIQTQHANKMGLQIRPEAIQREISALAKKNNFSLSDFRQLTNYDQIVKSISQEAILVGLQSVITRSVTSTIPTATIENTYQQVLQKQSKYKPSNIIVEDKTLAQDILTQLQKEPNAFSLLAFKHSAALNAKQYGDLGYRILEDFPEIYQQPIAQLSIGDISPIIYQASENLYHLLKLDNTQSSHQAFIQEIKINHLFLPKKTIKPPTNLSIKSKQFHTLETILKLYQEIKEGGSFYDLAKEYSKGDYAQQGGQLPWINIDKLPLEGKIIFNSLTELEVSPPFESKFGWHIIQRMGSRQINPLKQTIINNLSSKAKKIAYQDWFKGIKAKTYIKIFDEKIQQLLSDK